MTRMNEAPIDLDGQPMNQAFNYKRNKARAILTLKGILDGVVADQKLTDEETIYLKAWVHNDTFSLNDGDFYDIHEQMADILDDGVITAHELQDMQQMLQDILDYGELDDFGYESATNHLLGFLSGISADDELCDKEIVRLSKVLKSDSRMASQWPASAIQNRLDAALADGIVDPDERKDLLDLVKAISGQSLHDTGLAYGMSADFSTTQDGRICIEDKVICFTGKFVSGSRRLQEATASSLGANIQKNVTKGLDILVLGAVASRDWKFSSYGRKIETALKYREEGASIEIINEELWDALIARI